MNFRAVAFFDSQGSSSTAHMAVSVSLGVVRCKIFVCTLVLFCFQIVNTSPTGSPTGIMRIQNSTDNHGSLMRKLSKVRLSFVCLFVCHIENMWLFLPSWNGYLLLSYITVCSPLKLMRVEFSLRPASSCVSVKSS